MKTRSPRAANCGSVGTMPAAGRPPAWATSASAAARRPCRRGRVRSVEPGAQRARPYGVDHRQQRRRRLGRAQPQQRIRRHPRTKHPGPRRPRAARLCGRGSAAAAVGEAADLVIAATLYYWEQQLNKRTRLLSILTASQDFTGERFFHALIALIFKELNLIRAELPRRVCMGRQVNRSLCYKNRSHEALPQCDS